MQQFEQKETIYFGNGDIYMNFTIKPRPGVPGLSARVLGDFNVGKRLF